MIRELKPKTIIEIYYYFTNFLNRYLTTMAGPRLTNSEYFSHYAFDDNTAKECVKNARFKLGRITENNIHLLLGLLPIFIDDAGEVFYLEVRIENDFMKALFTGVSINEGMAIVANNETMNEEELQNIVRAIKDFIEKLEDFYSDHPEIIKPEYLFDESKNDIEDFINEAGYADSDSDSDESIDEPQITVEQMQENLKRKAAEIEEEEDIRKNKKYSHAQTEACSKMNKYCKYQPIDMDDWCEHDALNYYGPDEKNRCFDVYELLQHFETSCLGATKYGNPYPNYPDDPFNRQLFSLDELQSLVNTAEKAGINVSQIAPKFSRFVTYMKNLPLEKRIEMDGVPFEGRIRSEIQEYINQSGGGSLRKIMQVLFG